MVLFLVVYLGGVLTIVSPCILPVLPFVTTRADRPCVRGGLPLLLGMAASFAVVASLAAVGGWAVQANHDGLLRAPCAGPILGLVLTGAAVRGATGRTSLLLLTYAAGAARALALLVGGRAFARLKRSLGVGAWVRRGAGVAVLASVAAIALGLDAGILTRASLASTGPLEQAWVDASHPAPATAGRSPSPSTMTGQPAKTSGDSGATMKASSAGTTADLPVEGALPSLDGAVAWLNSPPLTATQLRGKVVLVDFWTYSCINCLREAPYVRAWSETYASRGLVVIGVHAPEFAFEKDVDNVRTAVSDLKIGYPVAVDNQYAIWRAFSNDYWPALYFVDARGHIRHHHFGEGDYDGSEKVIQELLAETGATPVSTGLVPVSAAGVEAAPDLVDIESPETYIGYARADNFVSTGGAVHDTSHAYSVGMPRLNEWGLVGDWTIGADQAALDQPDGRIVYRFHARDLHLVLGPGPDGKPVRFRMTIDGTAPGNGHGSDVDAAGRGVVSRQRRYQPVRQGGPIVDHTFDIRFLDPGVQAYAFTFG